MNRVAEDDRSQGRLIEGGRDRGRACADGTRPGFALVTRLSGLDLKNPAVGVSIPFLPTSFSSTER